VAPTATVVSGNWAVTSGSAGGFDYLGATVCCFTPGEFVDIYQNSVSAGNASNLSLQADSSGAVHFIAGSSTTGLQEVLAYPLGTSHFIAVGETSGTQLPSQNFQVIQKVTLSSSSWTTGDQAQVSGFAAGSTGSVCLNASSHSTGCDTQIGTVTVSTRAVPAGTALFTISPKPPTGTYQLVVVIQGQSFANTLTVS
jgi:hypothetical protein